jgi:hypothetical protein
MTKEEKKKSAFRCKKEKDIIYNKLYECSQTENVEYWKVIFSDMSRGLCPKGLNIQNGTLTGYNSKKNSVGYHFVNDDIEKIRNTIKDLFSNLINVDMESSKRNVELDVINKNYNDYKTLDWKNIKKKSIKEILLQEYVIYLIKKHNIKKDKVKDLFEHINNAFTLYKTHDNSDVQYIDGKIININDFEYCSKIKTIINKRLKNNMFDNVLEDCELNEDEVIIEEENKSFKDLWKNYLTNIFKQLKKN